MPSADACDGNARPDRKSPPCPSRARTSRPAGRRAPGGCACRRRAENGCSASCRSSSESRVATSVAAARNNAALWGDWRVSTKPKCRSCHGCTIAPAVPSGLKEESVSQSPRPLADCTATELVHLYRTGQASPVEATQAVLARIAEFDRRSTRFASSTPIARWRARRRPKRAGTRARRPICSTACRSRSRI